MSSAPRRRATRRELFECPHCGADVAVGAKVCRDCGSDATTGWLDSEEVDYASVELPDGYGTGEHDTGGRRGPARAIAVAAVALLVALAILLLAIRR